MRLTETIETGAGPVTVKELTVGEVRQWLASLTVQPAGQSADVVDSLLFSRMALNDLNLVLVGQVDYDGLTQAEVRQIIDAAERLNPDFFHLRQTVIREGEKALKAHVGS